MFVLLGENGRGSQWRYQNEERDNIIVSLWRGAGYATRTEKTDGGYRIMVRMPTGKKPAGRSRCGYEDNITIDLTEVSSGYVRCIKLAKNTEYWRAILNTGINKVL